RRRDHIPFTIGFSLACTGHTSTAAGVRTPADIGCWDAVSSGVERGVLEAQSHDARPRALDGSRAVRERRCVLCFGGVDGGEPAVEDDLVVLHLFFDEDGAGERRRKRT